MKENSIEEDIKDIEKYISFTSKRENFSHDTDWNWNKDLANKIEHILSDYKRVLKMNEVLLKENEELKNIELKSKGGAIKVSLEGLLFLENNIKQLEKENEELKFKERIRIIGEYGDTEIHDVINKTLSNDYISVQKVKDIIDRIDYDIKKTKEIISKNTNIYASYRKNDYQIARLKAMNTKSLDIKKRLQELLEKEQ